MRLELTGCVQREACSHRLSAASRVKSFRNFCESRTREMMQRSASFSRNDRLVGRHSLICSRTKLVELSRVIVPLAQPLPRQKNCSYRQSIFRVSPDDFFQRTSL